MKYFVIILASLISASLFSQDCPVDDWIEEEYHYDAQRLALREIMSDTIHEFQDSIFIPKSITEEYLGILSSVYFQHTGLTDTLFNHYSIHVFPDLRFSQYVLNSQITLQADTNFTWIKAYIQDSLVSGNIKFDSVTSLYNFRLLYVTYLTSRTFLVIGSADVLHLKPLISFLESLDGIELANAGHVCCDGNDIDVTFANDTVFINFSIGWGDCPSGCINTHYWKYSVLDCISTFLDSYGSPLPSGLDNASANNRVLYPNPAEDIVFIKNSTGEELTIQIYNLEGELILTQSTRSDSVDLSALNSGIYFLTIWFKNERETIKIFKL